jgi:hypothetical protein
VETRLLSVILGLTGLLMVIAVCHPLVVLQFIVAGAISWAVLWVFRTD